MRKREKFRQDCRGEMSYISTLVSIFMLLLFVVLVLNIFSVLTMRQNMQYALDWTLSQLASDGSTENAATYFSEACQKAGVEENLASYTLDGTQYVGEELLQAGFPANSVQYGDVICMQMTYTLPFLGGSDLFPSMEVHIQGSTLSEAYLK